MRLINRLLAGLLALALVVVGVLVIIEVVADRLNDRPAVVHWHTAYTWTKSTTWSQGSVRVTCIVIAALGLILLLAELKRSKPTRLPVDSEVSDTAYTRRGVAASVRAAVTDVDGVNTAAVKVRRRRVKVNATTAGLQPYTAESLREPATAAAQQRLDDLELRPAPSLTVRVSTRSR